MELRSYQKEVLDKAITIIEREGLVYLALEMRTGKTLISLKIAEKIGAGKVLFLTKKKILQTVKDQAEASGVEAKFTLVVKNYESVHRVKDRDFDVVILDEAHELGQFPKPNGKQKAVRQLVKEMKTVPAFIFLSGTPNPESYSQLYHQFWVTGKGPFTRYKNFYGWAGDYVKVYQRAFNGYLTNDYRYANEGKVRLAVDPLMITLTQEEAGFENFEIEENIVRVPMPDIIPMIIRALKTNGYWRSGNGREIVCDTPVKLLQKVHQLCSGTVIFESGERRVMSDFKAKAIAERHKGRKIAIYYVYQAEAEALRRHFPNIVETPEEFEASEDAVFISQIKSGAMGISLRSAECLVFMNIHYSASLYFQARARLGGKERETEQRIEWVFAENGIEDRIMRAVSNKKNYTADYFRRDIERVGNSRAVPAAPGGFRVVWA